MCYPADPLVKRSGAGTIRDGGHVHGAPPLWEMVRHEGAQNWHHLKQVTHQGNTGLLDQVWRLTKLLLLPATSATVERFSTLRRLKT